MANDDPSEARTRAAGGASNDERPELDGLGALLRTPSVTAAIGAIVGLGLGIVLGRSTVTAPPEPPVPAIDEAPLSALPAKDEPAPEPPPPYEVHIQVGRKLSAGKSSHGFERQRIESRAVAQLAGEEGVVRFELDAKPGDYVLMAIAAFEGGQGTLEPRIDGKDLGSWSLEPGWNAYSIPVPRDLLGPGEHDLGLRKKVEGRAVLNIDSIAIVPVGSEARFAMGIEAVGRLIEGFSNPEGRTTWSYGPRSVVSIALSPEARPYRLTVRAAAMPAIAPLSVACKVNGTAVGSADFSPKLAESTWSVPANVLRAGVNRIEFSYPKTSKPADVNPRSTDKRPLALRFARVELMPE